MQIKLSLNSAHPCKYCSAMLELRRKNPVIHCFQTYGAVFVVMDRKRHKMSTISACTPMVDKCGEWFQQVLLYNEALLEWLDSVHVELCPFNYCTCCTVLELCKDGVYYGVFKIFVVVCLSLKTLFKRSGITITALSASSQWAEGRAMAYYQEI